MVFLLPLCLVCFCLANGLFPPLEETQESPDVTGSTERITDHYPDADRTGRHHLGRSPHPQPHDPSQGKVKGNRHGGGEDPSQEHKKQPRPGRRTTVSPTLGGSSGRGVKASTAKTSPTRRPKAEARPGLQVNATDHLARNINGHLLQFRHQGKRAKRQLLYFVLSFLGEDGIRSYVKNTKTENFPALMGSVSPDEIIYIVSSLPPDEIMRVLTSLPAPDILTMSKKMTPQQLSQLLGYVPREGLANLTEAFNPEQLQQLVVLLSPEGIVNLTKTVPAQQAKKLMGSLSPEFIFNLTQSMSPATLVDLMTALPAEIFLDFTRSLHPDDLERLMRSMPAEVYMPVVSKLTAPMLRQLLQTLPGGFIESFMEGLSPEDMGQIVRSVKAEDVAKLLRAFPSGQDLKLNVTRLMRPEMISMVMDSLPKDLIANLTTILPPRKLASLVSSIPPEHLVTATRLLTAQQMADVVASIPPAALGDLVAALPPDLLVTLATSVPVDTIVNVSKALADDPQAASALMEEMLKPALVGKFSSSAGAVGKDFVLQLLDRLPSETIGKLAAALPAKAASELLTSMLQGEEEPEVNVTSLLQAVPPALVAKLASAVPPEVVARLAQQLSKNQLRKLIRLLTPEMLHMLVTSVPPDVMVKVARALPESVLTNALAVMQPKHFRSLVQAVPVETIQQLVDAALAQNPTVGRSTEDLIATTQKVANIMLSISPETLTRLVKAIPKEVLVQVIDSLPVEALAEGAAILSGEEGVPLASALPLEAVAYSVSVIPPASVARIVDALPQRTIGAFANMAVKIPHERIQAFFGLVQIGALKNLVTKLPPRTIEKLVSSVPLETVSKMAHAFDPVTVAPLMESLQPRELRRIIRSVNSTTLSNLLTSIPPDVIVNLTQALPPDQIAKLMVAIPPEIISQVITHMDPKSMIQLMKALPPSIIENMLSTLPTGLIVNMTKILPPESLQELMDLLPKSMMGKMISILPKDVLVDLVKIFDADAMLNMMQKLEPKQLMDILGTLPPELILNITKSQTPEQTMKMLGSMPPDGIVNLTKTLPTEVMMEMMQSVPPAGLISMMTSMPLKDLFTLAQQLTPQQTAKMIEKFAADKDLIPNLLAKLDLEFLAARMEVIPPELIMQVVSSVDMKVVLGIVQRFVPKVQMMVLDMMDRSLKRLARNSTLTFQRCLDDLGFLGHNLFNFSEWAFHYVDASGKPGRGMLEGNIHMIGNYDQCKKIKHVVQAGAREGDVLTGSYCHVQFHIPKELLPPIPGDGILPMPEIAMDVCLPSSCRDFDLHRFLKSVPIPMNVTVPRVSCQQDADMMQDPAAVIVVVVLLILVFFVAVGTILDCLLLRRNIPVSNNNNSHAPMYSTGQSGTKNGGGSGADDDKKVVEKLLQKDLESGGADIHEMLPVKSKQAEAAAAGDLAAQHGHIIEQGQRQDSIIDGKASENGEISSKSGDNDDSGYVNIKDQDVVLRSLDDENESVRGDLSEGTASEHLAAPDANSVKHQETPLEMLPAYREIACALVTTHISVQTVKTSKKVRKIVAGVDADEPVWLRLLTVFSITRSMRTLLVAPDNSDNILCLHGIRVLSMLWVIFANTVVFAALNFENLLHAANDLISMPAQVILNSSLAQDTFFTISGVVTAVAFLRSAHKSQQKVHLLFNIFYYYTHRLVRVIPAYAVVLAVCASLLPYVADGPHWPPPLPQQCQEQWWRNILFINNFFTSIEHMCMSWTWFLANLMQFYWIAPLILVPFALGRWWQFLGFAGVGALIVIHIASTAILELGVNGDVLRRQSEYFWQIYQQPWCRVAPYAMGLGLGYILHRLQFKCRSLHWVATMIGWVVCFATSTILCLITYDENRYLLTDAAGWSLGSRTAHETLQRPLWGLVVSWVVFACSTGNGGPIGTVLSWKGFLPLSRLTFCIYLIHPVVILCDLFSYRVFAYFSIGYVLFRYLGYVVVAYLTALILSLLAQSPFLNLEKTVIDTCKRSSKA